MTLRVGALVVAGLASLCLAAPATRKAITRDVTGRDATARAAATLEATTQANEKPPATSTTRPTARKPVPDEAKRTVRGAVIVLAREYEQFLRDPKADVRPNPSYFKDVPPAQELPADAIAQALLAGGSADARVAAYVKWQLLSGLPEAIDDATAKQLVAAYRTAPRPIARPGISPDDQQRLDRLVQGAKMEDEPNFIEAIDRAVNDNRRDNTPVLAYRDELYRRLPKAPETFAAAMDDLLQRLSAEAEAKEMVKTLVADLREWSATAPATPQTLAALAKAARRLADTKGPQYYTTPYWNERSGGFAWRKTRGNIDSARSLKDLAVHLEELSEQPPIDLTIKETK